MRRRRVYLILFCLLALVAFFRTRQFYQAETVVAGGREFARSEGWNQAIMAGINRIPVSLQVGGRNIVFSGGRAYVNENMDLMVPETVLSDTFPVRQICTRESGFCWNGVR